ncbi:MAG: nuclear transport factor 2 family protein [Proteobacteria bacterium]|nr:nuclear transport factor 2 family protein [Pseudomonadota bacterium]
MIRRMQLAAWALAPCALALAGCDKSAPPVADTAKEAAAINAQADVFNAAMKAGDVEKAIMVEANDIHGYGGGGPDVTSASQDLKQTKEAMHDPNYALSVKPEHTEVAKSGDLAWQYGTWAAQASDPKTGKPVKASGHWVGAWRKDDQGRWKLAAVSNAADAPAAADKK